jgi:hypothetical protein
MKSHFFALALVLSSSVSFAASTSHHCAGVVIVYDTETKGEVHLALDTANMTITLTDASQGISNYTITSSRRLNSYMRGTQFIEAKKVDGNGVEKIRLEMPWTSYYGQETSRLLLMDGPNSFAMGTLQCDNKLYRGPTEFSRNP